jgi:hypothetical protein
MLIEQLFLLPFSSSFARNHVSLEAIAAASTHTIRPPLSVAPAVAISHTASTHRHVAHPVPSGTAAELQRSDARKQTPTGRHLKSSEPRRRRQRGRMVLLDVHIPELPTSEYL